MYNIGQETNKNGKLRLVAEPIEVIINCPLFTLEQYTEYYIDLIIKALRDL